MHMGSWGEKDFIEVLSGYLHNKGMSPFKKMRQMQWRGPRKLEMGLVYESEESLETGHVGNATILVSLEPRGQRIEVVMEVTSVLR